MVRDFTVVKHGIDSSGRGIYMTRYMQLWWEEYCERLGYAPTITQGSFMTRNGGGATASAGYHDEAGALDLRVWDKTPEQRRRMVWVSRTMAGAAYLRDQAHGGMEEHIHLTLGPDKPLDDGLVFQWHEYLDGRDGLASRGPDYHNRPSPIVTDWQPSAKPTPNITAALRATDSGTRRNALTRVVNHGTPTARKAAKSYLAAMDLRERALALKKKAKTKASASRAALKKEEVR